MSVPSVSMSPMICRLMTGAYVGLLSSLVLPIYVKVPVSAQMMGISILIIIIASINAAERERKRQRAGDPAEERDVIGRDQAYRFPLVASFVLFGMFLAFKYLPKDWVSFLLTLYGVIFGGFAFGSVLGTLIETIPSLPPSFKEEHGLENYFSLTLCDLLGLVMAAPVTYWYYTTRAGLANNLLASGLALSGIEMLAISDFKTAAILLSGLFFYDIFWVFGSKSVFGSNVMVSVAKQFEGPIKLVFPQFPGASPSDMSMLGLGDIVVPGFFVALMLRFDIRNVSLHSPLPSRLPYFFGVVIAYFGGLVATYFALTVFKAAQPALLYLVPSCLLTVVAMAAVKGELPQLLAYTEEDETSSSATTKVGEKETDSSALPEDKSMSTAQSTETELKKEQ